MIARATIVFVLTVFVAVPGLAEVIIHQGKGTSEGAKIHLQLNEVGIVDETGDGEGDKEAFGQNRAGRTQNNHITAAIAKFDLRKDQPDEAAASAALRAAKRIELVFDVESVVGKANADLGLYLLDNPAENTISPKPVDFHRAATQVATCTLHEIKVGKPLRFDVTRQVKGQLDHARLRTIGFRLAPTAPEVLRQDGNGGLNVRLTDPRLVTDAPAEAAQGAAQQQTDQDAAKQAAADRRRLALSARRSQPRVDGGWQFPDGSVVDVTLPPYNADNTGKTDAAPAIQQALDDHRLGIVERRIIYLPDGTYRLGKGLVLRSHALDADRHQGHGLAIIGQSREGVVLQLQDSAAGFDNTESPEPVLSTTSGTWTNIAFMISVMNLTIDTGRNNPGAIGLRYIANNQGSARDLIIRSGDPAGAGWAGIDMDRASIPGPAMITRVDITGFDHGIRVRSPHYGMVIEHLTLQSQRVAGIRSEQHALTIRKLTSHNAVPAVLNVHRDGLVVLLDSVLSGGNADEAAIVNSGNLFARDIQTAGYRVALRNHDQDQPGARIEEFATAGLSLPAELPSRSLRLPIEETPNVFWDDPGTWVNVADFGARPDDWEDDAPAIQRAIDSMRDQQRTLYFPPGRWMIDTSITLRGNVRRVCGLWSSLATKQTLEQGDEPVFRIADMSSPLYIDMINLVPQPRRRKAVAFVHEGTQDVIFQHVYIGHGPAYRGIGTGRVFMEDVCALAHEYYDKSTPEPYPEASPQFDFGTQKAWLRQFDPEQRNVMVRNGGGDLWILGIKTEQPGTVLHAAGGRTEILGGTIMPVREVSPDVAAFVADAGAQVGITVAQHVGAVWKNGQQVFNGSYRLVFRGESFAGGADLTSEAFTPRQDGRSFVIPLLRAGAEPASRSPDAPAHDANAQ